MEEEYSTSSNVHRYINIIDSRFPSAPSTINFIYDSVIHEFCRAMANVSIVLDQ